MQGSDPQEPTQADVGKFLPTSELLQWHRGMQRKYQIYLLPTINSLEMMVTSMNLALNFLLFFDNDPNKLMRCEVVGSRYVEGEPMYVVLIGGELSQIALTSGHEEEGWKIDTEANSGFQF